MENKTVADLSLRLSQAIIESDEYKNYRYYYDELKKNPSLLEAVDGLRRVNFELQNAEGVPNMYDEVSYVFERTAHIRNNVIANRFLRSEMSLCRMVQEMMGLIFDGIELDTNFLEQ